MGRYSYAVSLQDDLGHFCGGSLIAKDVVLTAAHCQGGTYSVVIGRHDLDTNSGEEIQVSREVPHPDYDTRTTNNDFNLVFLERPTSQNVELVKLNSNANTPGVGDPVTVMGWGDTDAADDIQRLSDVLMDVEVNVISNSDCDASGGWLGGWYDSYEGQITSSMMCAADRNQDACQGDSGGPLVVRGNDSNGADDVQVGVVSWGIGCASQDFPGVYSRVSVAYDWIKEEVCRRSSDPPSHFQCGDSSGSISGGSIWGGSGGGDSSGGESGGSSWGESALDGGNEGSEGGSSSGSSGKWDTLVTEDFKGGFGFFNSGGKDATHYSSVKYREGVIRIQDGKGEDSTMYSNKIILDNKYSKFRVIFSFYALRMDNTDSFCLDYSIDGGSEWNEAKCWNGQDDFSNKVWYDDTTVDFEASKADSLNIRFRCEGDSRKDDVLIDKVKLEALAK